MEKTLIIGSCTVDIVIPTPRLPSSSDSINSGVHRYTLGGCAYNVGHMFRLLGMPCLHAVTIGSGIYGDYVKKELGERNIPIFRTSPEPHGACICLVEESGERSFIAYHGVEYKFSREWISPSLAASFSSVYICGLEIEEDTGEEIVAFLEENQFPSVYFAPGPRLLTIGESLISRLFQLSPIIHLNDQEITSFTRVSDIRESMKILYGKSGNDVIVTLGKDGAVLYDGKEFIYRESRESVVVDTVGAGDSHLGSYMAFRSRGYEKDVALEKANLIASEVVRHRGPSLTREELDALEI
ncbi:MAG: carbohydrate kinase family protein [Candidatus Ornithospirochaeta sp.]